MRGVRSGIAAVVVLVATVGAVSAQTTGDTAGVERAALDYLEGFYEGDEAKIRRGVHPQVVKYGFFIPRGATEYSGEPMTFQEMPRLA